MTRPSRSLALASFLLITGGATLIGPSTAGASRPIAVYQSQSRGDAQLIARGAKRSHALRNWHGMQRMLTFPTQIQHVVVIDMENRSVDNLFAGYYGTPFRGGPLTWDQVMNIYNPNNSSQPLTSHSLTARFDPHHGHDDGWLVESTLGFGSEGFGCKSHDCGAVGATAFSYIPTSEADPYAQLIQNYASADEVYQCNQGPSMPSHQCMIAGETGGITGSHTSPLAEAENPSKSGKPTPPPVNNTVEGNVDPDSGGSYAYCDTRSASQDGTVNMTLSEPEFSQPNPTVKPCETYASGTILDEIASAEGPPTYNDWQYVAHHLGGYWSAPTAVANLFSQWQQGNPNQQPFALDANGYNFVQSLKNQGNPQRPFATLTYLTPCPNASDHPNTSGTNGYGPKWVGSIVNAIGQSSYWSSTAIIITWDDWGGWFDHGLPPNGWFEANPNGYGNPKDPNEWGFRVPVIVVSPYVSAAGYVSHGVNGSGPAVPRSQSAILKLVETLFNLPSLHTDDAYANDNMLDMFNFSNSLPYTPVTGLGTYKIPSHC